MSVFKHSKVGKVTGYGDGGRPRRERSCRRQIIPSLLGTLLGDKDAAKAQRVMQAMLQMRKIDIKGLQQAADRA